VVVEDQMLTAVIEQQQFRTARDLCRLLPAGLSCPFHTGQLAEALGVERWIAQRAAYCLRETGAIRAVGKNGNAWLYRPLRRAA
jgi:hypothetical protein